MKPDNNTDYKKTLDRYAFWGNATVFFFIFFTLSFFLNAPVIAGVALLLTLVCAIVAIFCHNNLHDKSESGGTPIDDLF